MSLNQSPHASHATKEDTQISHYHLNAISPASINMNLELIHLHYKKEDTEAMTKIVCGKDARVIGTVRIRVLSERRFRVPRPAFVRLLSGAQKTRSRSPVPSFPSHRSPCRLLAFGRGSRRRRSGLASPRAVYAVQVAVVVASWPAYLPVALRAFLTLSAGHLPAAGRAAAHAS